MSNGAIKLRRDKIRVGALDTGGRISRRDYDRKLAKLQRRMQQTARA